MIGWWGLGSVVIYIDGQDRQDAWVLAYVRKMNR